MSQSLEVTLSEGDTLNSEVLKDVAKPNAEFKTIWHLRVFLHSRATFSPKDFIRKFRIGI